MNLEEIKQRVLLEKQSQIASFDREIDNIKRRIADDLQEMLSSLENISLKIKTKIYSLLDSKKESYIRNFDFFFKTFNELSSFSIKNPDFFEKNTAIQYLESLKQAILSQNHSLPQYTCYNDTKHSFFQVIAIMRKSFELFEEHFQDLLTFTPIKDLSDERSNDKILHGAINEVSLDRTVARIEPNSFELVFEKEIDPKHDFNLNSIAMMNEDMVITSSIDRSIHVFSLETNQIVTSINEMKFSPMVLCLIKSNTRNLVKKHKNTLSSKNYDVSSKNHSLFHRTESQLLASGGGDYDPNIHIWSLKTGQRLITLPGHTRHITTITQLPDKNILASGGYDSKIFIWDLNAGEPKLILNKHTFWIFKLQVSSCNNYLASCSWDRSIIIWRILYDPKYKGEYRFQDLLAERVLKEDFEVCNVNFSSRVEGVMVSSNIGKAISVWDLKTGKILKQMKLKQGFANELLLLEEKEDSLINNKCLLQGLYVVTSSIDDNKLRVFNIEREEEVFAVENALLSICAYNLNPKLQFFRYKDGDIGLVNVNHNDKNIRLGVWRIKKKIIV